MPSDDRMTLAAQALTPAREAFRSALVATAEDVRGFLASRGGPAGERVERLARELGPFAEGRIDSTRFAALLAPEAALDPATLDVVRRALAVLDERAEASEDAGTVTVPAGGDLRDAVRDALADFGRVFGAARALDLARSGRYRAEEHHALLESYPFRRWTAAERRVAPPLVVEVQGEDLRAGGLGDLLDGAVKVVILVGGAAPPAALARLISPGVWVGQSTSMDGLGALGEWDGPGVIAVFDPAAAPDVVPFVHDPLGGGHPWDRLQFPEDAAALAGRLEKVSKRWKTGAFAEDLAHLLSMATPPEAAGVSRNGGGEEGRARPTPADRLAAWLLARTDLRGA